MLTTLQRQRGFTLIEVMIVVAILGVLATLAGPQFNRMIRRSRVGEVARQLRSAFSDAQARSVASGVEHCVMLDRDGKKWDIARDNDDDPLNGCEEILSSYVIPYATVEFGPEAGFPQAFPVPYEGAAPRDAWCTSCMDDADGKEELGTLQFTSSGAMRSTASAGSIVVHDVDGEMNTVEGLVFIAPTGLARLVRGEVD